MWVRDVRAVTFGDAGTLRRPVPPEHLAAALHEALIARGLSLRREAFVADWTRAMKQRVDARWSELVEEPIEATLATILPAKSDRLADVVGAAIEALAPTTEWFSDALPTLDFLHESGVRLALVSDSPAPLGATWLARMAPWIDVTALSRDVGHVKPHPSMFKEGLRRLGVIPKQVLHVGDQIVGDVFGAKALGIRTALLERVPRDPPSSDSLAWLRRAHGMEARDIAPDLKIRTLEEIPAVMEEFA